MATQAALGQSALSNGDYPTAITHLTTALAQSQSPLWLIHRATAYQRIGQHQLALNDAESAIPVAVSRARRELIATAQLRRAIALHGLKRYGDARLCLTWCRKYNEKEKGLGMWQEKVKMDYEKAGGEDAEVNKCIVTEVPQKVEPAAKNESAKAGIEQDAPQKSEAQTTPASVASAQTSSGKIRHEWYQTSNTVTVTLFVKGVNKEQTEVLIEEGSLEVRFPSQVVGGSTYDFTISPFFSRVDPSNSSFKVTPSKIEILLQKSTPGPKWSTLEGSGPITSSPSDPKFSSQAPIPSSVLTHRDSEKAPSYPTSSRNGPKNWDAVANSALRASKDKENAHNKDDGRSGVDEDDDDESEDAVSGFFKKMYKDADDDTKKAMMKSYQESNGTALSTSWADVKKAPVKTEPPEGMTAKKWGQ